MGATELAAWWGAIVATGVAIWDVVKWKRRNTPRLKIETRQNEDDEFVVKIANIGEVPALIEEVRFICFARHRFFFRKQIELEPRFSLFGDSGSPPVTLASGEPWETKIGPETTLRTGLPWFSQKPVGVRIDIYEAHRRRPYRLHPDARRFIQWIRSFA